MVTCFSSGFQKKAQHAPDSPEKSTRNKAEVKNYEKKCCYLLNIFIIFFIHFYDLDVWPCVVDDFYKIIKC